MMLLLIVNVMLLVVGMFIDSTTATLLVVPLIAAPLTLAGVDPVHLGIVVDLQPDDRHPYAADGARAVPASRISRRRRCRPS